MSAAPLTDAELAYYDINAPLMGFMGAAVALIFSNLGAAYGTGKSGMGISALGVGKPELIMKSIVPVCAHTAAVLAVLLWCALGDGARVPEGEGCALPCA